MELYTEVHDIIIVLLLEMNGTFTHFVKYGCKVGMKKEMAATDSTLEVAAMRKLALKLL